MTNYLTSAWAALVRLVNPDVEAIIKAFIKAQSKLEAYITRELQQTERETQAIEDAYGTIADLMTSRNSRDANIDRAYRVIHKLTELTA